MIVTPEQEESLALIQFRDANVDAVCGTLEPELRSISGRIRPATVIRYLHRVALNSRAAAEFSCRALPVSLAAEGKIYLEKLARPPWRDRCEGIIAHR